MAATSKSSHDLEIFQLQADEGPCLDCFVTGQAISAPDLDAERARWPRFVAAATEAGFVSVHAVPMRAAGTLLGALGLFGTRLGALNDADLLVAHSLVHVACVAILQGHSPTPNTVGPSLRAALNDRVVVDQATGFVGETLGVPMEEAFRLLRQYAQNHPEHLTDTARQLVGGQPARRAGIVAALAELVPEV